VVVHHVGEAATDPEDVAILRRLMGEIRDRYGLPGDLPETPSERRKLFGRWLASAASRGGMVLVLDGIERAVEPAGAQRLAWLPDELPARIKLIVTTRPGPVADELIRRGWPTMELPELEVKQRRRLISGMLGTTLCDEIADGLLEFMAQSRLSGNPRFLRTLLEEIRSIGFHDKLPEWINHYLQAKDTLDLYMRILGRLEQSVERDQGGIVGESLSLIAASRRGLTEQEVMDIARVPPLFWSPLFTALRNGLVNCCGQLILASDSFRQAVRDRYRGRPEAQGANLRLAVHFLESEDVARRVDELPWQLVKARQWKQLYEVLCDPDVFPSLYRRDPNLVEATWRVLEARSEHRLDHAVTRALDDAEAHARSLRYYTALLQRKGRLGDAIRASCCPAWVTWRERWDAFARRSRSRAGPGTTRWWRAVWAIRPTSTSLAARTSWRCTCARSRTACAGSWVWTGRTRIRGRASGGPTWRGGTRWRRSRCCVPRSDTGGRSRNGETWPGVWAGWGRSCCGSGRRTMPCAASRSRSPSRGSWS
jgi:hypothetical protein